MDLTGVCNSIDKAALQGASSSQERRLQTTTVAAGKTWFDRNCNMCFSQKMKARTHGLRRKGSSVPPIRFPVSGGPFNCHHGSSYREFEVSISISKLLESHMTCLKNLIFKDIFFQFQTLPRVAEIDWEKQLTCNPPPAQPEGRRQQVLARSRSRKPSCDIPAVQR